MDPTECITNWLETGPDDTESRDECAGNYVSWLARGGYPVPVRVTFPDGDTYTGTVSDFICQDRITVECDDVTRSEIGLGWLTVTHAAATSVVTLEFVAD